MTAGSGAPLAAGGPDVTVVIAFLDEARFLPTAIRTVTEQTCRRWELILVDDGSTDGSDEIADAAAAADPARIRVVRHPDRANAGLPASRNLGLAHATAPRLCYLDADDRWDPAKLEHQLEASARHPSAAMVCGASWHQDADGRTPPRLVAVWDRAPRLVRRGRFARLMVRGVVRTPPPSDVMYDAAALRRAGGVPCGPNVHEDQRTFVAVSLVGPVMIGDVPLTTYTVRPDSVFGSQRDPMELVRQHREYEQWVVRYSARRGVGGLSVVGALMLHRLRRGLARRARERLGALSRRPR